MAGDSCQFVSWSTQAILVLKFSCRRLNSFSLVLKISSTLTGNFLEASYNIVARKTEKHVEGMIQPCLAQVFTEIGSVADPLVNIMTCMPP